MCVGAVVRLSDFRGMAASLAALASRCPRGKAVEDYRTPGRCRDFAGPVRIPRSFGVRQSPAAFPEADDGP
jgi:hypothetical protein